MGGGGGALAHHEPECERRFSRVALGVPERRFDRFEHALGRAHDFGTDAVAGDHGELERLHEA